ncbi:MAG TPA: hypothetical protein VMB50_21590 [Myxococcales bacterium]|nr:hypothetical protein [Myxococcales bacterium]
MWQVFREGGFPMFGIVGFGLAALAAAGVFAVRPRPGALGFIGGMAGATLALTIAGLAAALRAVFTAVPAAVESNKLTAERAHWILLQGISESMAPLIFGFTLLALTAFVCGIGQRRRHR